MIELSVKKGNSPMLKLLRPEKADPQTTRQFKDKLILENSKRIIIIMGFIAVSQLVYILLEATGVLEWVLSVFLYRMLIIFICSLFSALIIIYRRKGQTEKNIRALGILTMVINIIIAVLGVYFAVYMFRLGSFSFSVFLLVAYLLSLSYIRTPKFYTWFIIAAFSALGVYLIVEFGNLSLCFISEFMISLVFALLLCLGSNLNYQRYWSLFMQERKIREISERITYISQTDEITGIYNRRKCMGELEEQAALSKRYDTPFSIALLDIDNFKEVNDSLGHITGDRVLKVFADFLRTNLRETDIFGRWGGDEFIIIIPQCGAESAYKFLERLRGKIEEHNFGENERMTFSAGVSAYASGQSVSDIVNNADRALYVSKELGRNRISLYDDSM